VSYSYRCSRCGGNGYLMRVDTKSMVKCDICDGTGKEPEAVHPGPSGAVPAGWKIVPVKPTKEMIEAGDTALHDPDDLPEVYAAMLQAAPCATQGEVQMGHGRCDGAQCDQCATAEAVNGPWESNFGEKGMRAYVSAKGRFLFTVHADWITRVVQEHNDLLRRAAWTDEDQPLPEDAAIEAAHPLRSGNHDSYHEAMRLVGAKRSKGALVALVSWLLQRASVSETGTRDAVIEECAVVIESQRLTEPANAGGNKWGATGLMQTVCAAAVRALKGKS